MNDNITKEEQKLTDREVMEHTASIWKYNAVADTSVEPHFDSECSHLQWKHGDAFAARVRGKKHKHDGSNCDDWYELTSSDDFLIAVVSDGAGSKPLSRIGARVSCQSAQTFLHSELASLLINEPTLKDDLSAELSSDAFMSACGKVAELIQRSARHAFDKVIDHLKSIYNDESVIKLLGRNPELADLSCTFLAAAVIPLTVNGRHESLIVSAQIGDGCICALNTRTRSDDCLRLLGVADSGAFSGETEFLSEKTADTASIAGRTRISRSASDIVLLMTDGVADDYYPASPMMKRLYLDLCLNGALPMIGIVPMKQPPKPISFPAVSETGGQVSLQYAKQLLSDSCDIDELWNRRGSLKCHSLAAYGISNGDTPEQRLLTWLDNYNERGSFDDRTIVIIQLNTKE